MLYVKKVVQFDDLNCKGIIYFYSKKMIRNKGFNNDTFGIVTIILT